MTEETAGLGDESDLTRVLGVAVWPYVDGRLGVALALPDTDVALHWLRYRPIRGDQSAGMIRQIEALLPPDISYLKVEGGYRCPLVARWCEANRHRDVTVHHQRCARQQVKRARAALQGERLRYPRTRWRTVPADIEPYLVATDASVTKRGAAWAYITGGGWYATGLIDTSAIALTEWAGLCEGLHLYPDRSKVTALVDNEAVVRAIQSIASGDFHRPPWLTSEAHKLGLDNVRRLSVDVQWVKRNTHELHSLADELCGYVSRGLCEPTTSSALAREAGKSYGSRRKRK